MDLKGWERSIDRVDMQYRTVPNFKGQATVCVEGLELNARLARLFSARSFPRRPSMFSTGCIFT